MKKYVEPTVTSQEVHFVPETRVLSLPRKPYRVWTVISTMSEDPGVVPPLPMTPIHGFNAFLEDYVHDWNWANGKFRYYSRVALHNIWILVEYSDK